MSRLEFDDLASEFAELTGIERAYPLLGRQPGRETGSIGLVPVERN